MKAAKAYRDASRLEPQQPMAVFMRAKMVQRAAARKKGDKKSLMKKALRLFKRALALRPASTDFQMHVKVAASAIDGS